MSLNRYNKIQKVLSQRQYSITILLENVHKEHNYAAVLRTCDALGIAKAHAVVSREAARKRVLGKKMQKNDATAGAGKWVDIQVHETTEQAYDYFLKNNYIICAADCDESAIALPGFNFHPEKKYVFVVGTEKFGLSDYAKKHCHHKIYIPMLGMVESFNVSVASSLLLYEYNRQKINYEQPNEFMPPQAIAKKTFEWMHPRVAKLCQNEGKEYPALDDAGFMQSKK